MTQARTLAALVLLAPSAALADGFENVPTGSRTAAMGGAAMARGSDSAMPALNPAGMALVPSSTASLSASLYSIGVVSVPNFYGDERTIATPAFGALELSETGLVSKEFSSFPSGLSYFAHFGDRERPWVLGAAIAVPRFVSRKFITNIDYKGVNFSNRESITAVIQEQQYQVAVALGTILAPKLRFGAAAVTGATLHTETSAISRRLVGGSLDYASADVSNTVNARSIDVAGVVGVQYGDEEGLNVGMSVRSPSLHLNGNLDFRTADNASGTLVQHTGSTNTSIRGDFVSGMPLRVGVGAAYQKAESWGIALDVVAFLPRKKEIVAHGESRASATLQSQPGGMPPPFGQTFVENKEFLIDTKPVINLALGGEVRVTAKNWLRLGGFTDMSAFDRKRIPYEFPVHRFGFTAGWGTLLGPVDTTLGIRTAYGSGETGRRVPNQLFDAGIESEATPVKVFDFMAFVSAAVDTSRSYYKAQEEGAKP